MHCNEIQPLLSPFHDCELPPEQARDVAEHVENCQSCSRRLESLKSLSALVVSSRSPATPSTLLSKIESSLDEQSPSASASRIRRRNLAILAGTCAAAVVVTVLIWQLGSHPHDHSQ